MAWRPPYILILQISHFSNLVPPPPPPPPPRPSYLSAPPPLFFLLLRFFGWMGDHSTFDVLFYLMIIWIYTCQAFVPEGPWCVFYATRRQVYCRLTHNVFYWNSDLISHKHTQHTQGPIDWHTHFIALND